MIDTNVLVVAEGLNPSASDACQASCVDLVEEIREGLVVALDTEDRIVNEYLGCLKGSGGSGVSTKLVQRLYRLRFNAELCRRVDVTPIDPPPGSYEEVPTALRDFDTDDQKFIAVAAAEGSCPPIHTAVDGEWWERRSDFAAAGLDVQFACPGDLRRRGRT